MIIFYSRGSQLGKILPLRGYLAMSGNRAGCRNWTGEGGGCAMASSGQRPGMMLNILPYAGQSPRQGIFQLQMLIILRQRIPALPI